MQFLSYSLDEKTPTYGNGVHFKRVLDKCIEHGASCNQMTFSVSNHVGTHLDCPFHFDQEGLKVTDYAASFWECQNISLIETSAYDLLIDLEKYESQIKPNSDIVLVKTGFCNKRDQEIYWSANPGIAAKSADFLRRRCPQVKFLGMDLISLTSYVNREEGKKAHQAFLRHQKPILIIEDMDLRTLTAAPQKVLISPLRITNADGGPVTVFSWAK
jgi:kynurenine formamidase